MLLQNHSVSNRFSPLFLSTSRVFFPQPENLPFLAVRDGSHGLNFRCRTTFYTALSRLLMIDLGEEDEKFVAFMTPIAGKRHECRLDDDEKNYAFLATFQKIGSQLISGEAVYSESELKVSLREDVFSLRKMLSFLVSLHRSVL